MNVWLLILLLPIWISHRSVPKPQPKPVASHAGQKDQITPATSPSIVTVDAVRLPLSPGYHRLKTVVHLDNKIVPIAFGVFMPRAYYETHEPMPVVVALHTRAGIGNDGQHSFIDEELALLTTSTREDWRATGEYTKVRLSMHTQGKFICLMPQCPTGFGWESPPIGKMVEAELNMVLKAYQADSDRVYLTGFSYGGSSTWRLAMLLPDAFAAIAPIDARQTLHPEEDLKILSKVPVYLAVGQNDTDFVRECNHMNEAMQKIQHADYVYRTVPNGNHFCYPCVYEDPTFWDWMFSHRRSHVTLTSAATQPARLASQP